MIEQTYKEAERIKGIHVLGAAAAAAAGAYLVCDSRYHLETTGYTLSFEALPRELDGFRIVQLSDLHGMRFGKNNRRLADAVLALRPDLIALTGDMAGHDYELCAVEELLDALADAAPIYAVNGNHEWIGGCGEKMRQLLSRHGAHCLSDEYIPLCRAGARIVICGAEDYTAGASLQPTLLAERLRRDYPRDFVLWLVHRNHYAGKFWSMPVQLVLCGHAHGGLIRLPGLGGLFSVSHTPFAEYETGLYRGRELAMVVSRGLGNSVFIPRILNRPEIVCIELRSGK